MKTYRSLCALAIAMLAIFSVSAQEFCNLTITKNNVMYNRSTCDFVPDRATHSMGKSYNDVYNQMLIELNDYTPSPSKIKAGDEFQLIRTIDGHESEVIRSVNVTSISSNNCNYTLKNAQGNVTKTSSVSIQYNIIALLRELTQRDNIEVIPGTQFDAQYQLKYIPVNNGTVLYSNVEESYTLSTEVEAETLYRSGTPDPENNAEDELYTCRVKFKPIAGNITRYDIYQNVDKVVACISQEGTDKFYLMGKDKWNSYSVKLEQLQKDDEGFLSVRFDVALNKKANEYELSNAITNDAKIKENDLFFTVVVVDDQGNTYGNVDRDAKYFGHESELVYAIDNTKTKTYNGEGSVEGYFRAEVAWKKMWNAEQLGDDDYIAGEPEYFTVHRQIHANGETTYTPLTNFYVGHEAREFNKFTGEYEDPGFKLYSTEDDGTPFRFTPALIAQLDEQLAVGFKVIDIFQLSNYSNAQQFPARYYVKAHYADDTALRAMGRANFVNAAPRNYIEKNSNTTLINSPVVTAVDDINASEVVSVKYYNLMGVEVMNPAAGEIVIARKQYANGTSTSKVIKM